MTLLNDGYLTGSAASMSPAPSVPLRWELSSATTDRFIVFAGQIPSPWLTAQTPTSDSTEVNQDPLIDRNGDLMIYGGVAILAVLIGLIIGVVSKRMGYALLFSLGVAAILMLLAIVI